MPRGSALRKTGRKFGKRTSKERQAEYDRRIAKADYLPDLYLSVQYLGLNNIAVLPQNVGVGGFLLTWEPFDWGRRRNNVAEKAKTVAQARNGIGRPSRRSR